MDIDLQPRNPKGMLYTPTDPAIRPGQAYINALRDFNAKNPKAAIGVTQRPTQSLKTEPPARGVGWRDTFSSDMNAFNSPEVKFDPAAYIEHMNPQAFEKPGYMWDDYLFAGRDPEGRKLSSVFHAGTDAKTGMNVTPSRADLDRLAHVLTSIKFKAPKGRGDAKGNTYGSLYGEDVPEREFEGTLGMWSNFKNSPRSGVGALMVDERLDPATKQSVLQHELGHAVHARSGNPNLSGGEFTQAGRDKTDDPYRAKAWQTGDARTKAYLTDHHEITAENFRQYLQDPARYKALYPDAAAKLRKMVNENPNINRILTLSRADALRNFTPDNLG